MASSTALALTPDSRYPDSDGKRMAENTLHAEWITRIFDNLRALFADRADVFIAADNLIYPLQVEPGEEVPCQAPDVYVVFGRPRGYRGSYKYWEEANVPVTVAFEILSPSNDAYEMVDKLEFYNEHGIEEYYVYDPDTNRLWIYTRKSTLLTRVRTAGEFVSPRLGIRFERSSTGLLIRYPDGRPFADFHEERQRADVAERRLEQTEARLARLVELSRKARASSATPEELAELARLEAAQPPSD